MELMLKMFPHPLTGAPRWSLWRVVDGKAEAGSFVSPDEARDWATQFGHTVAP